jgi:putative ABC transport system permease protein
MGGGCSTGGESSVVHSKQSIMIRNYFTIAWRNLMKYKTISFINLFGLTVGLTCCLLILCFIGNELSYDKYNEHASRIYRVTRDFYNQNGSLSLKLSTISPPFGPYLQNDFPDIQKITRLLDNGNTSFRVGEKIFTEKNVFYADENLFDVFTVRVLEGNPKEALKNPFSVMLSEETAAKYFGQADPMNKTIRYGNKYDYKVMGIYRSLPQNAHLHPSMLLSFNTLKDSAIYGAENLRTDWGNNSFFTYLLMPENYPLQKMEAQFPAFLDRHMNHKDFNGQNPSKFTSLGLQKLTDIHLRSHTDYEAEENGDISRVYIFSAIALFILLIACINYMNLSTARSALRAREIGIRKVIGAQRKELIFQFLTESVLLTCFATLCALGIVYLAIPLLNKISQQQIYFAVLVKWQVMIPLLFIPFVIGILSGLYPALFMSAFQPVKTLKGIFKTAGRNISFRQALVITQFSISIVLIISTLIVFQQLRYMQQKSLGFDKAHVVTLDYDNVLSKNYESFRSELLRYPGVLDVARSSRIPSGRLLDDDNAYTVAGDSVKPLNTDIKYLGTDVDFIPTFAIHMAAGRNFSRDFGMDTSNFIVNEAAVKVIGWKTPTEAIGKNFKYGSTIGHIIGVVTDFHFESLHQQIRPMVFLLPSAAQSGFYNNMSVKISGQDVAGSIAHIETTWRKYLPDNPFNFTFLDQRFDRLYSSEQRQGALFMIFAFVAIFIACLGLFGLSAFAITQRIKEIGIRKVLGATVTQIVSMISKDFLRLVVVASLIAFPVAWYAMHNWLSDFAYRTPIGWWIFLEAALAAALIALVTISFQALKAAVANPADSLHSE